MVTHDQRSFRIAFVDYVVEPDKPGRSGLSDIVWDMASELICQGHEAHIIASYHTNQYPDHRVSVHNFPTPPMGYRNILGQLWLLKRAATVARQIGPDIIHTPEYVSTAVFATLRVPVPLVLTVPGNIFHRLEKGHSYEWHFVQVLKWAAKVSARRCASVIAISSEMKRWWELTGSSPDTTPYIPYGINTERFHHIPDARERLQLDNDKLIFLYVGRFAVEKGIEDLINAVSVLKLLPLVKTGLVQFILIGEGPQKKVIQAQIAKHQLEDIFLVLPWVPQDQLALWYSAANALIMPSWNEPLGKVMLEAMACGTPVIASETEGPKDHIIDQKNGFLYPAQDTDMLASILLKCMEDPQGLTPLRRNALDYIRNNLSWNKIVSRVIKEVYQQIA